MPLNRIVLLPLAALGTLVYFAGGTASAIDLESLVSPGPVIEGHADVESECGRCHSPFDRGSEAGLCLDCHEKVAADLEAGKGFHGAQPATSARSCRGCHSEHLGRSAHIVVLDAETFDHDSTDYPLVGAHPRAECGSCHPTDRKHREAPHDCVACHADDDVHETKLGKECSQCHSENAWGEARFDHDETDFALDGGHVGIDCALCHPSQTFKDTAMDCQGCHTVDDAHQGRFGERCGDCHETSAWKRGTFDHDKKTKFPLLGKHRKASCESCHRSGVHAKRPKPTGRGSKRAKDATLDMRCIACHRADDDHRGSYGANCEDCHSAADWSRVRFDHKRDAGFALSGAHREVSCRSCHRGALHEEELSRDCYGCHAADDVHRKQEGTRCESCHDPSSWTAKVTFDHELTSFPLLGLHGVVACEECHATMTFKDAPQACNACHLGNDVHHASLGSECGVCHNPNGWKLWRFDHARQTSFALHGAHKDLDCRGCHHSPAKRGGRRETSCESCHGMDDPHRGSFGSRCEDCHLDTSWDAIRIQN